MQLKVSAIIAAGGKGERIGGKTAKQYLTLGEVSMLAWSVSAFVSSGLVSEIIVGAARDELAAARKALAEIESPAAPIRVVSGGKTRQDTVRNCINFVNERAELIVIHDAARPFVSKDLIERTLEAAKKYGAATATIRPTDTVKLVNNERGLQKNLDRNRIFLIQTPQAFKAELIRKAHQRASQEDWLGTDDTALVERLGVPAVMVESDTLNFKITQAGDLKIAQAMIKSGLVKLAGRRKRQRTGAENDRHQNRTGV